jgi:glycosyltransferase involved in cell wall biosynthesis
MLEGQNIICFAPNDWWGMNPSCTTHITLQLAQSNKVLFVNPFSSDLSSASRRGLGSRVWRKLCSLTKFLKRPKPNLYVFSPIFLPIQGWRSVDALNNILLKFQLRLMGRLLGMKKPVVWVENLRAADLLGSLNAKVIVYHVSDLFAKCPYTANAKVLEGRESSIIAKSDLLICVSKELFAAKSAQHPNVHYLPHGVDFELFRQAANDNTVLSELADIPKPVAGYFGTLTANNDIELLEHCARNLPAISFVFAGQITGGDYSRLSELGNVHFLGKMPYERIPSLAADFDVCLLPWKMDDWFISCNPLKLFEYMASGRPIVSVKIDEVARNYSELVSVANNKEEFCRAIEGELKNDMPERSKARIAIASQHGWDKHVEMISQLVNKAIIEKLSAKSLKVCLVASAGGHLTQLLKLAKSWEGCKAVFVTTSKTVASELQKRGTVHVVSECNRLQPLKTARALWECVKIVVKERPDVIISTGAAAGCMICFLGKLVGARVLWVDSITNTENLSLSGRMVRHIADLFLVQWPELAAKYKNVEYEGPII